MEITAYLAVNGNINIVDYEDDDSPLARVEFMNEAKGFDDEQRLRIAAALRTAIEKEFGVMSEFKHLILRPTP